MKNALSMHTILNPNIELIRKRLRKGIDSSPFKAESFGKNWIGPDKKNLLIPKDEENRLRMNVRRGKAELKLL